MSGKSITSASSSRRASEGGRRLATESPYRLCTGQPYRPCRTSGTPIRSWASAPNPCSGPNSAASRTEGAAASRSAACLSRASTAAGFATRPPRRPRMAAKPSPARTSSPVSTAGGRICGPSRTAQVKAGVSHGGEIQSFPPKHTGRAPPKGGPMPRSRWVTLFPVAILCAGTACTKTRSDQGTAESTAVVAGPVAPAESTAAGSISTSPQGEAAPGDRDVPTDLTPLLIWAEMGLPEGTTLERGPGGSRVVRCGKAFAIEISAADRPLAETKAQWADGLLRLLIDEPYSLFAELRAPGATTFAFETRA